MYKLRIPYIRSTSCIRVCLDVKKIPTKQATAILEKNVDKDST
jgi:hypothetical protein